MPITPKVKSLSDHQNSACDLHVEEKYWIERLIRVLEAAGIDIPNDIARLGKRSYERIEEKWKYARLNGCFSCDCHVLEFSSASELNTGDTSAPGRLPSDGVYIGAIVDVTTSIVADTEWTLSSGFGTIATITLPGGDTYVRLDDTSGTMVNYGDMPIIATCTDDGGGGWEKVTITSMWRGMTCGGEQTAAEGGGGEEM